MALHLQVIVREEAQATWGRWEGLCLCLCGMPATFHACSQCRVPDHSIEAFQSHLAPKQCAI
jgi:hypothetical protein